MNLADMISHQARRRPGHPAIVAGEDVITHGALDPLVRGAAVWLMDHGARPGDVIGLALADTAEHLILHYAVARMGGIILPIDWRWTADEKNRIAGFFGARLAVAEAPGDIDGAIGLEPDWRAGVTGLASDDHPFPDAGDAPVVLSLSSGTTGRPKGPALSHNQFLARWITQFVTLTFTEHDRYLNAIPLYFGGGRSFSMSALYAGATVILYPPPYEPEALIAAATHYEATTTLLVPTLLRRLLAAGHDGLAFPSLRLLLSTGAILHPDERDRVMAELCPGFINYYGSTEGGGVSVLMAHHAPDKASSVGATVFGVDVEIVGEDDAARAEGEVGRIRYRGPGIADGFYRDAEASAEAFRDGWFYPGDLGRLDGDGFLYLAGRADDTIIRGGVNIYPAEIEEILLAHPAVTDAKVIGVPSDEHGQEIAAFVVAPPDTDPAALDAHCRDSLAPYKRPRVIEIIDAMPKTALGKVIKADLVARLART